MVLTHYRKVIEDMELDAVVPIPRPATTLNSYTNPASGSMAKATNGDSQFYPVTEKPTKKQIEKLIGLALSVGSEVCINNHMYI